MLGASWLLAVHSLKGTDPSSTIYGIIDTVSDRAIAIGWC